MELEKNKLDQWLDQALDDYGHAEPRLGLETRILANLAAEKNRVTSRSAWLWAFASVVATAFVAVALWWGIKDHKHSQSQTEFANSAPTVEQKPIARNAQPAAKPAAITITKQGRQNRSAQTVASVRSPKLTEFPSSRPLSTQEQLLARYAREFPQQALEIAQAQASAQAEREREELAAEKLYEMNSSR